MSWKTLLKVIISGVILAAVAKSYLFGVTYSKESLVLVALVCMFLGLAGAVAGITMSSADAGITLSVMGVLMAATAATFAAMGAGVAFAMTTSLLVAVVMVVVTIASAVMAVVALNSAIH